MSKPKFDTVTNVPQWATCYLVNDDPSGISDEDRAEVDKYVAELAEQGMRLVCPIDGTENEFSPFPAFGLACDTVDWTVEITKQGDDMPEMKTREQELNELINKNIEEFVDLYDSITAVDGDVTIDDFTKLIDERVRLEIELHEIEQKKTSRESAAGILSRKRR